MKYSLGFFYILLGLYAKSNGQVVTFRTVDGNSLDAVSDAAIYVNDTLVGVTNNYGYFSQKLICQTAQIKINHISYEDTVFHMQCDGTPIILQLRNRVVQLPSAQKNRKNFNTQFGSIQIPGSYLKTIPFVLGEQDALKAIQLFPGVSSAFETNSGIYVRGGNIDQTAIYLDDAPVYNVGHFYGFFSPFDGEALKSFTFYNSGLYSGFGSRGSSVLDVRFREGNMKHRGGSVSLGILSSKLLLEGPIIKNKLSYLGSVRFAYPFALYSFIQREKTKNQFVDGNIKLKWQVNKHNTLYASSFISNDAFSMDQVNGYTVGNSSIEKYSWGNKTATLRWNHIKANGSFLNTIVSASKFSSRANFAQAAEPNFGNELKNYNLRIELDNLDGLFKHSRFGVNSTIYQSSPAVLFYQRTDTPTYKQYLAPTNSAMEACLFGENTTYMSRLRTSVTSNLRIGMYHNLDDAYTDLIFEPRIKFIKQLKDVRLYAAFDKSSQYQNYAGNRQIAIPSDYWLQASRQFKGQKIYAYTIGASKEYGKLKVTLEGFYKQYLNALDVRDGGNLFRNPNALNDILIVKSQAYGAEFLIEKYIGKIQGHCSYTVSRSIRKNPEINNNAWFASNFDRTHMVNAAMNYVPNRKWSFGFVGIFQSGTPVTANYAYTFLYSLRNEYRLPYYYRVDASVTKRFKFGKHEAEWNISVFNVFFIKNRTAQYDFIAGFTSLPTIPSFTLKISL